MENKIRRRKQNKQAPKGTHLHQKAPRAFLSFDNIKAFISFLVLVSVLVFAIFYASHLQSDRTLAPFGAAFPLDSLLGSQYWSSLLSGHYFGLRAASPNSPIVSMMWFRNRLDPNNGLQIRHWCSQNDNLKKFFWNYNDLKFGHQSIHDQSLQINTSFIKLDQRTIKARFSIVDTTNLTEPSQFKMNSFILYSVTEDHDDTIEALNLPAFGENGAFTIRVQSKRSGNYFLHIKIINGHLVTQSYLTTNSTLDQLKETVLKNMYVHTDSGKSERIFVISNGRTNSDHYKYNFVAYQVVFQKKIQIEVEMLFDDSHSLNTDDLNYEKELSKHISQFDQAFEEKFPLRSKNFSDAMVTFARAVLSNTIGGISYFYGHSLVKSEHTLHAKPYGPLQLLTAVPSRPFFPRGFLWDEGFHQLLISSWDPQLSKTIIKSWFGLMNKDGWIPREVILGDEAMARVPSEFLVQDSTFANPPALFLAIENLIDQQQADKEWLTEIFPRLESWFQWFNATQQGQLPLSFRWRGRNATTNLELNPKTLTSGLDDFPRASHPTDDEIHLDLRCWMALASRVMAKVCKALSINDGAYSSFYDLLRNNQLLDKLHWSPRDKMYCDRGLHTDAVRMVTIKRNGQEFFVREVLSKPSFQCIAHFGYVNLFPLIMGLLDPTNPKLETILQQIEDPQALWTPYGLRSLSSSSFYYDKYNTRWDAPYWRGPIWIPVNFLVLKGLNHYSTVPGAYQAKAHSIYVRLRENLIQNVFKEYRRTNYVWEHYSDKTGQGQGTYPMTGWTALIVRIMGENY